MACLSLGRFALGVIPVGAAPALGDCAGTANVDGVAAGVPTAAAIAAQSPNGTPLIAIAADDSVFKRKPDIDH